MTQSARGHFAHAISRATKRYDGDASAQHVYLSFLVQAVGARRDWSSQEVGHSLRQVRTSGIST